MTLRHHAILLVIAFIGISCTPSRNTCHDSGQEDYSKTIDFYEDKIENEGITVHSLDKIGMTYYKQQAFEKAIEYFDQIIKLEPDNSTAYSNKGLCHLFIGQQELACENFAKVIEIGSDPAIFSGKTMSSYIAENCQ